MVARAGNTFPAGRTEGGGGGNNPAADPAGTAGCFPCCWLCLKLEGVKEKEHGGTSARYMGGIPGNPQTFETEE